MIMIMSVGIGVFAADEEIADFSKANKVGIINDTNTLNKIKMVMLQACKSYWV